MTSLRLRLTPSEGQPLAVLSTTDETPQPRPVVAMLHGALRHGAVLAPWIERLAGRAEVLLVDLPGHGRSAPLLPATVEGFAAAVVAALRRLAGDRPVVVAGESMGGLIALAIAAGSDPGPVRAVAAFDPPMTAAKLWNVHHNFRRLLSERPDDVVLRSLAHEVFGMRADGQVEERIFYPFLERARLPAVIATGDLPLLPPRAMNGVACLFDPVDQYVARRLRPDIEVTVVPGAGHLLLTQHPAECEPLLIGLLDRHAATGAAT